MSNLINEKVRERLLDVRDWFEIRPDPHWWPSLGIPGVVALAYFTVPHNLFPFLIVGAVLLALVFAVLAILGGTFFVLGRILRDVTEAQRAKRRAPQPEGLRTLRRALQ